MGFSDAFGDQFPEDIRLVFAEVHRGAKPVKCRTITIRQAAMIEIASCITMRFGGITIGAFAAWLGAKSLEEPRLAIQAGPRLGCGIRTSQAVC